MPPLSNNFRNAILGGTGILAFSIVAAALIGAFAFLSVSSSDHALGVTGSAKKRVLSDTVKWQISISREVPEGNLALGYRDVSRDTAVVQEFLRAKGIPDSAVTVLTPSASEQFKFDPSGSRGPRQFLVRQPITVQSEEVARVTEVAKDASELAARAVSFESYPPEYFYSKLSELRVELLAAAIRDAKARAAEIARGSERRVGKLKSASSGVVQVLAPNSIEISDYGQYDTASVEKEVMVTVRASFFMK